MYIYRRHHCSRGVQSMYHKYISIDAEWIPTPTNSSFIAFTLFIRMRFRLLFSMYSSRCVSCVQSNRLRDNSEPCCWFFFSIYISVFVTMSIFHREAAFFSILNYHTIYTQFIHISGGAVGTSIVADAHRARILRSFKFNENISVDIYRRCRHIILILCWEADNCQRPWRCRFSTYSCFFISRAHIVRFTFFSLGFGSPHSMPSMPSDGTAFRFESREWTINSWYGFFSVAFRRDLYFHISYAVLIAHN